VGRVVLIATLDAIRSTATAVDGMSAATFEGLDLTGHTLAGRYRVTRMVGKGGMGVVYEAEQLATGRAVALKMLLPGIADTASIAKRFRREANAASLLDHPNIIEVLDLFIEGESLVMVMELVHGTSLATVIARARLATRRSLVIARQVLEALTYAHERGMVHRDLKPENVMLERVGAAGAEYERAKLLDFGLVKLIGDAPNEVGTEKLTQTGLVFGTPAYMAPEQVLGRRVDHRVDLYALGVVVFEMLTGAPPFHSADATALMRMQVQTPAPSLASVATGRAWCTRELDYLVGRALAKRADDRFTSARDMTAALDDAFRSLDHLPADD
jgi:serine/threonine-protein kinase